jgi:hypothetical protein
VIVARDPERAIELMRRLDFTAVVLGVLGAETPARLLDRIAPLPVVFYGADTPVAAVVLAVEGLRR